VKTAVPSPIQPVVAPKLPSEETFESLLKYDSDDAHIRKQRSGASPGFIESLRYISLDSYPTKDMWLEDGNIVVAQRLPLSIFGTIMITLSYLEKNT
jgi:hypothetical protein